MIIDRVTAISIIDAAAIALAEIHCDDLAESLYAVANTFVVEYQGDRELLESTIEHFGEKAQILMAIEEMAELTKELLKNINRKENNRMCIGEEMADVEIMLDQLKLIYNNSGEVSKQREFKLERLSKRVDILENGGD